MTEKVKPHRSFPRHIFWAFYASYYDSIWDSPVTRRIAETLGELFIDEEDILDFGSGTGLISRALRNRGHRMTAVDPSQKMIERAIKRDAADEYFVAASAPTHRQFGAAMIVNLLQCSDNPRDVISDVIRQTVGPVVIVWPQDEVTLIDLARWEWQGPSTFHRVVRGIVLRVVVGVPGMLVGARRQSDAALRRIAASVADGAGWVLDVRDLPLTGCVVAVLSASHLQSAIDGPAGAVSHTPSHTRGNDILKAESL